MNKVLIVIVVVILIILGVRSFAPTVDVEPPMLAVPLSAAEQEIDAADLGDDIETSMQEIDNDLNAL